ncbi:hypothetical protein [Luteolibacter sp. LG18]|uniref:hypothetical protein n=1 Tax=Luteolibacter sp. LG18 TaxID=2819286 RepID=UPI002B2A99BE|nr:hypothetical protein llg_11230 [Luteolibacter sp. LG18]
MSDFRKQVRDYYDAQSLSPEKVEAVLAEGRAVTGNEPGDASVGFSKAHSWRRFIAAIAAVLILALAGGWWMKRDAGVVSYTALAPRVIEFFDTKSELLPPEQDKQKLWQLLVDKGAPEEFRIPPGLMPLESAACQVVNVKGRNAWMSCYWREPGQQRNEHQLIHLLVARTDDFYDQPKSTTPEVREIDGWSFASWTKGKVIYTLATAAPKEKLTPFLSSAEKKDDEKRRLSYRPSPLDLTLLAELRGWRIR